MPQFKPPQSDADIKSHSDNVSVSVIDEGIVDRYYLASNVGEHDGIFWEKQEVCIRCCEQGDPLDTLNQSIDIEVIEVRTSEVVGK